MGPGPAHGGELRTEAALAKKVPQAATPPSRFVLTAGVSELRNRHAAIEVEDGMVKSIIDARTVR